MTVAKMSWRPVYRSSKFRNVYGKVGGREQCFDGIPVTRSVHDSHFCAVNAKFLAVVTESAGGGAFVVIPVTKAGRIDPNYPKVCGHQGSVLDIKWNPFMDNIIASCSEDCSVVSGWYLCKWVGWYQVVSLLTSLLSNSSQEADCKSHRVNRVVFLGNMKKLATTGVSRWNSRQVALWDQEDLSMPLVEEEIDGLSGLLFPFYDPDTHMLYLAGKGDGNIRYYEVIPEKPYLQFIMEFHSPAPQKGLGVMPKRGLDVGACEVFRFYKLVTLKGLVETISMIVPRRSEAYQEDLYPMTAGPEPALSADEWLRGVNRGPVLMSLKASYKPPGQKATRASRQGRRPGPVHSIDLLENVPPKTHSELLRMFFRQEDELRQMREDLVQKDQRIQQLELELKNLKNNNSCS
ncbi:coronin-2B-like [Alosa alosa]|uniref:coronin-2B-like n=1 Tax=Alosa alosa TaxID=278164 RepID=UPI0020150ED3|nr:coronin-2B-like [Alosa alosa]